MMYPSRLMKTKQRRIDSHGVISTLIRRCIKIWRSQNAEKITLIKGRLLNQAAILFNIVPFQNRNFSERANSFLKRAAPYGMEKMFKLTLVEM